MRFILAFVLGAAAISTPSGPETIDLIRLTEATRLAEAVRERVWPGWDKTAFPVLLVGPEQEFLVGFPRMPPGFTDAGYSSILRAPIRTRPRQLQPDRLATFPALGPPSVIVVGRAEATNKLSTSWVLTILHEHFHQYQNEDPTYYSAVEGLGLSGGDQTGMWMLNYPFPYQDARVADEFAGVARLLGRALKEPSDATRRDVWRAYADFLGGLAERDRKYLSFQVWQEGVSRYVKLRVAEVASRDYEPSLEFRALSDDQPFAAVADEMRAAILLELASPDLPKRQRVSFYAFGAGLALLLDKDAPGWKRRYLTEKFFLEKYRD